jgi:hypothetical protein
VNIHIDRWSYWLGLLSAVIALVMRAFNAIGIFLPGTVIQGTTIWYMSFYKAALLFLLINIATDVRMNRQLNASDDKQKPASRSTGIRSRAAAAGD